MANSQNEKGIKDISRRAFAAGAVVVALVGAAEGKKIVDFAHDHPADSQSDPRNHLHDHSAPVLAPTPEPTAYQAPAMGRSEITHTVQTPNQPE